MKLNVLVVDDDDDDFMLLTSHVGLHQYDVALTYAEDGIVATQSLTNGLLPNLIIADAQMPRMNGLELVSWLRSTDDWRHIPVVVWTGSSSDADIRELYRAGANSVVVKDETLQAIQTFCQYWFGLTKLPRKAF